VEEPARSLPVALADLPDRLSRELDPGHPRRLTVTQVHHVGTRGGQRLVITVEARPGGGRQGQRWRLHYDLPPEDLALLGPESFVSTVRANIEEWWDTRPEAMPGLTAERLD
jgi:hypothetical protein